MIKERMEATTDQKILKKLTICVKNMEFERNDRMFAYGVPARPQPLNGAPYSAGLQRTYERTIQCRQSCWRKAWGT